MVQAIVFLPLLGAVLAGLIALFGAHARNPSGDTVEHHEDGHGHGAHAHASAASINQDAAVIHEPHHEPGNGHDDHAHGPAEPAAAGSRPAELITTVLLFVS